MVLEWPDGSLRLLVTKPGGDLSIGFQGYGWHTHGSILAELSGQTEEEALGSFIRDIIEGVRKVYILKNKDVIVDVWVDECLPENTAEDVVSDPYLEADEVIELKRWRS